MISKAAPPYRHDLDGLRAIAVLAVLGYHAGYNDFAGGFMGVDVFLVLSGYLITQQISAALSEGHLHLTRFWLRRVRRLLPAMLPVLAFALLSALLLKGQGAFEEFAGHFLSAGFFYSNYQFLTEADYFARASNSNLLLHTWSLSLEWQFYLVTPLVLMAVQRFGRVGMLAALAVLASASLAFAEYLIVTGRDSWAFFGVMPRFWEFAAGGIIALLPRTLTPAPLSGAVLRATGLGLVLWSIFGDAPAQFPGLGAAWTVAGTALILLAPTQLRDPVRWLLERRLMQWVGVRSYAIYLIHWPLMVTAASANGDWSEGTMSAMLLISLFLGHLIYRYVETPVRTGATFQPMSAVARFSLVASGTIVLVWALLQSPVLSILRAYLPLTEFRTTADQLDFARDDYLALSDRLHANSLPGMRLCSFDDRHGPDDILACLTAPEVPLDAVLLIGDSHGRDTLVGLMQAFPDAYFVMLHQSACSPATYVRRGPLCFPELETVLTGLHEAGRLARVILSARWWFGEHLHVQETLAILNRLAAESFVIGPGPTFDTQIEGLALEAVLSGTAFGDLAGLPPDRFAFNVRGAATDLDSLSRDANAGYFNRYALFCPNDLCPIFDGNEGQFLYMDNQHLSLVGMDRYAEALMSIPALRAMLTAP